jgi:hypothetical protein
MGNIEAGYGFADLVVIYKRKKEFIIKVNTALL